MRTAGSASMCFFMVFQLQIAHVDNGRVVEAQCLVDAPAAQEPVRASRVAHDHREVPFGHTVHADAQMALGLVRHVVSLKSAGSLFVRHKCATWRNHRCAGATSSCRYRRRISHAFRRSRNERMSLYVLIFEQVKFVVVVEAFQWSSLSPSDSSPPSMPCCASAMALVARLVHSPVTFASMRSVDIVDADRKADDESPRCAFLGQCQREEAIREVIIFGGLKPWIAS